MVRQVPFNGQNICTGVGLDIRWQDGPMSAGVNGSTVEQVIRAAIMRLEDLDRKLTCHENRQALAFLNAAVMYLELRTRDRATRGVTGTATP